MQLTIPSSLKAEHDALHQMLHNAEQLAGESGEVAKRLAQLFHHHSNKEEQFVFPLLALLPLLAEGKFTTEMSFAIELSEKLKSKLADMLEEHHQIVAALQKFSQIALKEHHPVVAHFGDKLMLHAKNEEEIIYPAAILVGEFIRLKIASKELRKELY